MTSILVIIFLLIFLLCACKLSSKEDKTIRYKIDIWKDYKIIDTFSSSNHLEVLNWYKENYKKKQIYFTLYRNNCKVSYWESKCLGFYD